MSWYEFACAYASCQMALCIAQPPAGHRRDAHRRNEVLIRADAQAPPQEDGLRRVLRDWAFSARARGGGEPPHDLAPMVRWLAESSIPLGDLVERGSKSASIVRAMLDRVSRKQDGTLAAANTANRKRMVLNNAMEYACEIGALPTNPLKRVKWAKPRTAKAVDPRVVLNSGQARKLLAAVGEQGEIGQRLVAFFACMYYAALRPGEVMDLRRDALAALPPNGGARCCSQTLPRGLAASSPTLGCPASAAS